MQAHYLPGRRNGGQTEYTSDGSPILGMDFGTTNSVVACYVHTPVFTGSKPVIQPQSGNAIFPSAVYYDARSAHFVAGMAAYRRRLLEPQNVVTSVKRKLDEKQIFIGHKPFAPEVIVREIMCGMLRSVTEATPGAKPLGITVTVPYYFMQPQNLIIRRAAEAAISEVFDCRPKLDILPEPVASAVYWLYAKNRGWRGSYNTLVFDIGGGTFDLSVIRSRIDVDQLSCEVIACDGRAHLGGDDIDKLLFDHVVKENGIDLSQMDERQLMTFTAQLTEAAEEAKRMLSDATETAVAFQYTTNSGTKFVDDVITRDTLERLLREEGKEPFMKSLDTCVTRLMSRPSVKCLTIDYIVLVGGTTRMPIVRDYVKNKLKESEIFSSDSPDDDFLCVAKGAAIYSTLRCKDAPSPFGKDISKIDFTTRIPHDIFIERYDHSLDRIIRKGRVCPVKESKIYYPTRLTTDGVYVLLQVVNVYQDDGSGTPIHIGSLALKGKQIHAHGRKADDIPIKVEVMADATLVRVNVTIPQGNEDKTDFKAMKYIEL